MQDHTVVFYVNRFNCRIAFVLSDTKESVRRDADVHELFKNEVLLENSKSFEIRSSNALSVPIEQWQRPRVG